MTKQIQLTRGMVAVVDDEDFDRLGATGWLAHKQRNNIYAARCFQAGPVRKTVLMHREIVMAPSGSLVDHVNGDTLDNRRSNLRICNKSENGRNRKLNANSSSGFKGVCRRENKWLAQIQLLGKKIHLGRYNTPQEAARAYDEAARKHHGSFAKTNF